MKKYFQIFQIVFLQYFTYRLSFILWRLRNVFNLLLIFFLWSGVFGSKQIIFNYTHEKIISYILLLNITSALVLSSRTTDIANDILSGNIINYLLKPISFFKTFISRELADKTINIIFSIIEVILLMIVLKPTLFIQTNLINYFVFFIAILIGGAIAFFINLSLSFIAFWTSEVWAPRFIYFILINFLAGSFFPLDILPQPIYNFFLLTPFPYLIFLPIKIYLNGLTQELLTPLIIGTCWSIILYYFSRMFWLKGIKQFSFYGR